MGGQRREGGVGGGWGEPGLGLETCLMFVKVHSTDKECVFVFVVGEGVGWGGVGRETARLQAAITFDVFWKTCCIPATPHPEQNVLGSA